MGRTKELFYQLQEEFVAKCQAVENGDISILDAVIDFRKQKKRVRRLYRGCKVL